ncbi:prepilin peptidase [Burkholderia seminalis]|uniref:A24 family peptidase n=1 Tax=Burkholderia TaxID=32008 RepID=UPI0006670FC3|nr:MULTISPECIES: prepilin peptidase [Burkholderia]MBJ9592481.1 prepilin peptidase [Burkholderia seminalis]MBN3738702.1 prepilin peptidase [Burkholderia sp. Tr-20355]MCA7953221.1 prepilin peptidase [Burkholderia seminalis]MCA8432383.1 prepilin peptidase [Burkholderia seminalis]RQS84283.1 prepilin peptidase [Burkholderia seminalis]
MILLTGVGVFLAWAVLVALEDIRHRRIPNSLVIGGFVAAFVLSGHNPFGISVNQALVGVLIGLISLFPFFVLRVMGAADVKVFAVLGAWCGAHALLWLWIVASLLAFAHAGTLIVATRTPVSALWQRRAPTMEIAGFRASPYAAFLVIPAALWCVYRIATGGIQ